jgi:hypothetical protein
LPNYSRSGRRIDRRLVAAYLDGLLDAAAATRVTSLLESDPAWAAEHERQKRVRELLAATAPAAGSPTAGHGASPTAGHGASPTAGHGASPTAGHGASERVWRRLTESLASVHPEPLWRRKVAVPFPAAAAAAALVLVLAFGLVYVTARGSVGTMRITTVPSGIKQVQIQASLSDLQLLLKTLETGVPNREVIISLPDESGKFFVGEPMLLRATDVDRSRFR